MSNILKLSMQLPCIQNIETVAHAGLDKIGEIATISIDKIEEAKLLVNEAINNAIEHAVSSKRPQIRIEFSLEEDVLMIYVRDYGPGFIVSDVEEPHIEDKIGGGYKRGWGLKLMESLSDDFRIESGKYGTKIFMHLNIK